MDAPQVRPGKAGAFGWPESPCMTKPAQRRGLLWRLKDGYADLAAVRYSCSPCVRRRSEIDPMGGEPTFAALVMNSNSAQKAALYRRACLEDSGSL